MPLKKIIQFQLTFLLIFYSISFCQPGSPKQLGKAGDWKLTLAGVVVNDYIYTAEQSGALYETNPITGFWKQIGKPEFGNTKFMFAIKNRIFSIEKDGSLYNISPGNGSWNRVGSAGAWVMTIAGTTLRNRIYTVESSGALYETNPENGRWIQIGKPEFKNTRLLFSLGRDLYSIELNGNLYRINPDDGSWKLIGKGGEWINTSVITVHNNLIYSIEKTGELFVTDPWKAEWKLLNEGFRNPRFLFALKDHLCLINTNGDLIYIAVK